MHRPLASLIAIAASMLLTACQTAPEPAAPIDRAAFNLAAQRADQPILWVADDNGDGRPQPGEIAGLLFFDTSPRWVEDGRFTPEFDAALAAIVEELREPGGEPPADGQEAERRRLVRLELDQGRPSLLRADLGDLSDAEREFLGHLMAAGALIDRLHARQFGIDRLAPKVPADDPASRRMFRRNWGAGCVAPQTQNDPACTAIPGAPQPAFGVYPETIQPTPEFCATLQGMRDAAALVGPFTAVRESGEGLVAIPYPEAFPEMAEVAERLRDAARALPSGEEQPLRDYLEAAAVAFETNDWPAADEAWAAMNVRNSRWYLRIAPDEVYWEPCALKAGFHATVARTDSGSLAWQDRLDPLREEMERQLAEMSGPPYRARAVAFKLPDFIRIVANFGDDRAPVGGTAGQSLPNWGAVAGEGRGRTMAVTNMGTDPDSRAVRRAQLASLIDEASLGRLGADAPIDEYELLQTILHEAAHNLGPAHEYEVDGRDDSAIFGGSLASTMEELKAQTFGQWLVGFIEERGVIDESAARETHAATVAWTFRHIARGMVTGGGNPRPYSQLAAIQLGYLLDDGAIRFDPEAPAGNGEDRGAFHVDFARLPAAWEALAREVGQIKAQGDAERAESLRVRYVEGDTVPFELIRERINRFPDMTFVYDAEAGPE